MSDTVTPDSQKSTLDQAKDQASGAYEKVAGAVQPEESKSTTQKATDKVSGGSDDASSQGKGYLESAQDTIQGALGNSESLCYPDRLFVIT